jgi:alkanesulfonate monooxygenase SsuD/methylene tetrahydromethanopterin reductase-like flavin-dependent oxidoreductase (luciferase family)
MAGVAVHLTLPIECGVNTRHLLELAHRAEQVGFDGVAAGEFSSVESTALMGAIAATTERVAMTTCVLPTLSRSPALLAMGAVTLDDLSGSRYRLGLGAGSPIVAGFHEREFERPLAVLRDHLDTIATMLRGGRDPKLGSFRFRGLPPRPVPVLLAGVGDATVRLAAQRADGILLSVLHSPLAARAAVETITRTRSTAGLTGPFEVGVMLFVLPTSDDVGIARVRAEVASKFSVPTYRNAALTHGTEQDITAVGLGWATGGREAAAKAVPDEAVANAFVSVDDTAGVRKRLADFAAAGVTAVYVMPVSPSDPFIDSGTVVDGLASGLGLMERSWSPVS